MCSFMAVSIALLLALTIVRRADAQFCTSGCQYTSRTTGRTSCRRSGERWSDGCLLDCQCNGRTWSCQYKCPIVTAPAGCQVVDDPNGGCCKKVKCGNTICGDGDCTYRSKSTGMMECRKQGERWSDGCLYNCQCDSRGWQCQAKCSTWYVVPYGCRTVKPPGQCCEVLQCSR